MERLVTREGVLRIATLLTIYTHSRSLSNLSTYHVDSSLLPSFPPITRLHLLIYKSHNKLIRIVILDPESLYFIIDTDILLENILCLESYRSCQKSLTAFRHSRLKGIHYQTHPNHTWMSKEFL